MKELFARIDPRRHLVLRLWMQLTAVVIIIALFLMLLLQLMLSNYFYQRSLVEVSKSTKLASTAFS